jgi:hypothetical protein
MKIDDNSVVSAVKFGASELILNVMILLLIFHYRTGSFSCTEYLVEGAAIRTVHLGRFPSLLPNLSKPC